MNPWVVIAVVALVAIVILAPSGEPLRRAERLIAAWRRQGPPANDDGTTPPKIEAGGSDGLV